MITMQLRYSLLSAGVFSLALLASPRLEAAEAELSGSRPNIILVLTDDQGMGDLSCMGNAILKTPHLDRFHAQSTRFTDFQVSPTCAPTRAALMSGRPPFEVGVSHTILQRERMAPEVVTFPQALQQAGYSTGLFGKWHLGDDEEYLPQNRGFDEVLMHGAGGIGQFAFGDFQANTENTYFDSVLLHNDTAVRTKGFCTDLFFQSALAWIREKQKAPDPWFAFISLNAPHGPMIAPDNYKQRFLEQGYNEKTAGRYGMIENIDANVGLLMEKLEQWDALENTLVIFMTDNGMAMPRIDRNGEKITPHNAGLRGGKNSPEEGGTHVPSFWHWQGVLGEGADIPALAAHVDLYRTFCELAGAEIPESSLPPGGRSLVPLLEDPQAQLPERRLFVHCGRWKPGEREQMKYTKCAVRTQRWRLVDHHRLHDISQDPGQKKDVAEQHPEVVEELRSAYDAWWQSTEPLLVNESLPKVEPGEFYLQRLYQKQHEEACIPEWQPDGI